MTEELRQITEKFTEKMRETEWISGAWKFGSQMHGGEDEYSDSDIVFWVNGAPLSAAEKRADEVIRSLWNVALCYKEDFNGETIVNNGYLIKGTKGLLQLDVFLLSAEHSEDYFCKLHMQGLKMSDIIFDKKGDVAKLAAKLSAEKSPQGSLWQADKERLINTYRYHCHMAEKYLRRLDFFKLNNIFRILYDTHASLLLTDYDKIEWGGIANKLAFIPAQKQEHLKKYYCTEDFEVNEKNLKKAAAWFSEDCCNGDKQQIN